MMIDKIHIHQSIHFSFSDLLNVVDIAVTESQKSKYTVVAVPSTALAHLLCQRYQVSSTEDDRLVTTDLSIAATLSRVAVISTFSKAADTGLISNCVATNEHICPINKLFAEAQISPKCPAEAILSCSLSDGVEVVHGTMPFMKQAERSSCPLTDCLLSIITHAINENSSCLIVCANDFEAKGIADRLAIEFHKELRNQRFPDNHTNSLAGMRNIGGVVLVTGTPFSEKFSDLTIKLTELHPLITVGCRRNVLYSGFQAKYVVNMTFTKIASMNFAERLMLFSLTDQEGCVFTVTDDVSRAFEPFVYHPRIFNKLVIQLVNEGKSKVSEIHKYFDKFLISNVDPQDAINDLLGNGSLVECNEILEIHGCKYLSGFFGIEKRRLLEKVFCNFDLQNTLYHFYLANLFFVSSKTLSGLSKKGIHNLLSLPIVKKLGDQIGLHDPKVTSSYFDKSCMFYVTRQHGVTLFVDADKRFMEYWHTLYNCIVVDEPFTPDVVQSVTTIISPILHLLNHEMVLTVRTAINRLIQVHHHGIPYCGFHSLRSSYLEKRKEFPKNVQIAVNSKFIPIDIHLDVADDPSSLLQYRRNGAKLSSTGDATENQSSIFYAQLSKLRKLNQAVDLLSEKYFLFDSGYVFPAIDFGGSGRLYTRAPNLQHFAKSLPFTDLKSPRSLICADDDHEIWSADYCEMELRMTAILSKDDSLFEALKSPDVFEVIARKLDLVQESRADIKLFFYGLVYELAEYREFLRQKVLNNDIITDYYGKPVTVKVESAYAALNTVVQSSCAFLLLTAVSKIDIDSVIKLLFLVHDEAVLLVPKSLHSEVPKIVKSWMETKLDDINFPVKLKFGSSIECPQKSGVQRLSIRMAESEGRLRQDTVFSLSCNPINEIYPWEHIPQGVQDLEREDCHYTGMFDPIMDTNITFTCNPREYVAGISRVTDTRLNGKLINAISIEKNLYKVRFCDLVPRSIGQILTDVKTTKPKTTIQPVPSTTPIAEELETDTSFTTFPTTTTVNTVQEKQESGTLDVFDSKVPSIAPESIPSTINQELPSPTSEDLAFLNKNIEDDQLTIEESKPEKTPDDFALAAKAAGVKQQPDSKQINEELVKEIEEETKLINTDLFPKLSETSGPVETISADEFNNDMLQQEKYKESSIIDAFERRRAEDSEEMDVFEPEVLPSARITLPTKTLSKKPTHIVNPLSFTSTVNNDSVAEVQQDFDEVTLPSFDNFPSPPPAYHPRKIGELPHYTPRRPTYVDSAPDFEEYDDLFRPTSRPSYVPRKPLPTTRHPPPRTPTENQYKSPEQPYVDEETGASPFENDLPRLKSRPQKEPITEILETEEEFVATANPKFRRPDTRFESESPFEIRRSPVPRGPITILSNNNNIAKEELDEIKAMPTIDDTLVFKELMKTRIKEVNVNMTKDGVKNFKPPNNLPMEITEEMLREMEEQEHSENTLQIIQKNIETLVPMNAVMDSSTAPTPATSTIPTTKVATTETTEPTSTEPAPLEEATEQTTSIIRKTTTPYDPASFYHTVPVPKTKVKEKYLTFCTKDLAIRDSSNMIVACGDGLDMWYPPRCPQGTACFYTEDSTFRICCPVFDG
ncbi:hypothetical protein FO519_001668 [Halicephalobus sp. NKZ332]|nr:hypothetical protein FO519_001668 [Halicephalobus sp. NKZ332]